MDEREHVVINCLPLTPTRNFSLFWKNVYDVYTRTGVCIWGGGVVTHLGVSEPIFIIQSVLLYSCQFELQVRYFSHQIQLLSF